MMALISIVAFAFSVGLSRGAQPLAPAPIPAELRDLPWGQLNILHSTDTHGWHGGHLQEPSFSADWGDYISFAHHMRKRADKEGVDLLLVDTGDKVEGNGLYDASEPKGKYTREIFKHQDIDVICSGNHELYKANTSRDEFDITIPDFKGSYLASNIDIWNHSSHSYQPFAPRYKIFTTKNLGIRILAFGFIFNFQQGADNTKVTPVEETIRTRWFRAAIREEVDLFLVAGHVAIRSKELDLIYAAIRSKQSDVPILFLGGHTHIRDYKLYDNNAHALESGRYMETIGFASISGFKPKNSEIHATEDPIKFGRRYIDNNLYSYYHHSGLNESTFPTDLGLYVTKQITAARRSLNLDEVYGCTPRNLWLFRAKPDSKDSVYNWVRRYVLPDQFSEPGKDLRPKVVITNSGALRFDVFEGPFTRDSSYLLSPFTSGFHVIPGVESAVALKIIDLLNEEAPVLQNLELSLDLPALAPPQRQSMAQLGSTLHGTIEQLPLIEKPRTPGYTTRDDAGNDGDDTIHSHIQYFSVPSCIQAKVDFPSDEQPVEKIDLIYNEFLEPWVLLSLRFLGRHYHEDDVLEYQNGRSFTDIIASWVRKNWPCADKIEEL